MLKVRKRTNCTKHSTIPKRDRLEKPETPIKKKSKNTHNSKGTGRSLFGDGVFSKKPRPQTEIDTLCLLQILSKHGSLNQ